MATKYLTIIQQNDTHGYLWPHPELFWMDPKPVFKTNIGGFAKTAAVVKSIRKTGPTLFIDSGDVFHGTGPVVLSQGAIVPPLLAAMGLDVMVPGNWDYAYGVDTLLTLIQGSQVEALAANVQWSDGKSVLPSVGVRHLEDIAVGLVGLTYSEESQAMPKSFSQGLKFEIDMSALQSQIQRLRDQHRVDVVVLVSHLGLPQDLKLANEVNGIDVVLSGHSHDRLIHPIKVNNTWIIQSGANGSFLGILSLEITPGKPITQVQHELKTLDMPEGDPDIQNLLDHQLKPYQKTMDEVIGLLGTPLHRMTVLEAPMDQLICDAYLSYTEADVAFSHGWRYGAPILPGPFTRGHLFNMIPTNPELFITELDGITLREFLEQNLESVFADNPFSQKGGYVVRSSGLLMAFKSYNPKGSRIEYLAVNNKEVTPSGRYQVASAGPQGLKGVETAKNYLGISAHDVIESYFKQHRPVIVSEHHHAVAL
ncbi:MAG: bifunctional metallophosphatase/5'-nucleotidase [Sulfobacillus benefaciens]|uniref:Bifunctional metallophosphatase/5'-nucleotidase n=1 Tax=Sulfobacillus benefaciens TaxID=453960 RepID=A0A2T2XH86_9FIRM|nr:MAG: bifunctional metallophosphatase/5'-nucleotidase [Sulfobacillus benefaciens]